MPIDHRRQTVLVTGASSGIGRAFALAVAARGSDLVLVARRRERLDALARQVTDEHGTAAHVVAADLTHPDAARDVRDDLAARGVRVTALVNNAGFGTWGPFTGEDAARLDAEIALDVAAPVRLAHAFLPALLDARTGYLVNVASVAAFQPTPRMAVYGASKAFVLSWTESLWAELRHTGLTVATLVPGATATEFNDVAGDDATAGVRPRTPEQVVATALAHLARRDPGPTVVDGAGNRVAVQLQRFVTRRRTALLGHWLTDPARRGRPSVDAAHAPAHR